MRPSEGPDSQADSAGSIPVTRSTVRAQVKWATLRRMGQGTSTLSLLGLVRHMAEVQLSDVASNGCDVQ